MKINVFSLQGKIRNLAKDLDVSHSSLYMIYFFDGLLKRLSKSNYSGHFIAKGGFLLSSILGVQNRSTIDMDFSLIKQNLSKENIETIFSHIISIDVDDSLEYILTDVSPIRETDEYGGFRVTLIVKIGRMNETMYVDIATGDSITPSSINYRYKCLLTSEDLLLKSYNIETILAEKLQTTFERGVANTRSKDYYDIYILFKLKKEEINQTTLIAAFKNTCTHRNTIFTTKQIEEGLEYADIMEDLEKIIGIITEKEVAYSG